MSSIIGENIICNQQCQILCTPNHTRCPSCVQLRSAQRLCLKSPCPEKVLTKLSKVLGVQLLHIATHCYQKKK